MSVLRKYGAGLVLSDRTLSVELFGKRLSRTALTPTSGQVLSFNGTEWEPGNTASSLPSGAAGAVLVFDGGQWKSSAIPSEGLPLVGHSGSSATWSALVAPLIQESSDPWKSAVSVCSTLSHRSDDGFGLVGMGARCEFRVCNDSKQTVAIAAIDGVATDVTASDEFGALDLYAAELGTLTRAAHFTARGVSLAYQGAAPHPSDAALALGWGSRAIVVRDWGDFGWLDVWRVDGLNNFVFGSNNNVNSGGTVLLAPDNGEIALRRNSVNHLVVQSSGAMYVGSMFSPTTLRGSAITIGMTSVVTEFLGGQRRSVVTVSSSWTLDASHDVVFVDASWGAVTLTLPPWQKGRQITIQRVAGSASVVVERAGSDLVRSGGSAVTSITISDDARRVLIARPDAAEWVAAT
ncbi:MAG: hypothetical protein U0269_13760 [Polyangiales bacterium]